MDGLFINLPLDAPPVAGFGASRLIHPDVSIEQLDVTGSASAVRQTLRDACPCLPGVYGMTDVQGELVYVGMSSRLRDRLLTYFTKGPPESKEQRVAARAARLTWEVRDHELLAQLRELELIRQCRPRFNAVGRPGRREMGFVLLTATDAPNLRVAVRLPRRARRWWGPLPLSRRIRGTVRHLNQLFLLRDCPDKTRVRFAQQLSMLPDDCHPSCLRGDVGACLAPCAGDRSQAEYMQGVQEAVAFLDGRSEAIVRRYHAAMLEAAACQQYEQAASFRDTWQSLGMLRDQLHLIRHARGDYAGVHQLRGCSGQRWWVIVAGGHVDWVARRPSSRRAAQRMLMRIQAACAAPDSLPPNLDQDDYEQMRIISSWYRQHADQTRSILSPQDAIAICQRFG